MYKLTDTFVLIRASMAYTTLNKMATVFINNLNVTRVQILSALA